MLLQFRLRPGLGKKSAMRALVVYESLFGSARELAEAVGAGLGSSLDVRLVRADNIGAADAGPADVLVAGGPTHARPVSTQASRHDSTVWGKDTAKDLRADQPEPRSGLLDWFDELDEVPALFAAFDTRIDIPRLLTGAASVRIGRELRRRGSTPVVPPESFLVTRFAGLKLGEAERGRRWGDLVAEAARRAQRHPSTGTAS
jgi:hypothetical protein